MNIENVPAISIIVPVYKVEAFIYECVDSILMQSFKNFELLLIDDGSPDNCGQICEDYALKDARVRVIHKKNGGLSDARNVGIDNAHGVFLTFIDSDDFISDDYLQRLYDVAIKYNADIVEGAHTSYVEKLKTNSPDRRGKEYEIKIFNKVEALSDYMLCKTMYANAWSKLYKRELFQNVRYPLGKLTEDEYTTYKAIVLAKKVACIPERIYFYRLREGSIVRSFSEKRFDVCRELPLIMRNNLKENGLYVKTDVDYKTMRVQLKIYNDFVQAGVYKQYKNSLNEIQNYIKGLSVDYSKWDKKYILIRLLLCICPGLYRSVVRNHRKKLHGTSEHKGIQ